MHSARCSEPAAGPLTGDLTGVGGHVDAAGALDYLAVPAPVPAAGLEVVPGVHWLRLPLPFRLNHINVWLLADDDGWTLVDAGADMAPATAAWDALTRQYFTTRPLRRIVITHHHVDHVGLAGWLARRWDAAIVLSRPAHARALALKRRLQPEAELVAFYRRHGLEAVERVLPMATGLLYDRMVSDLPEHVGHVADGQEIAIGGHRWRVLELGGHAEGHLVMHDRGRGLVLAGDQALPDISANVSLNPSAPDANPLAEFLASLRLLARLPGAPLVLPAHGAAYRRLATRCAAIAGHHEETCARVLACCDEPLTAAELVPRLFPRPLDEVNFALAFGETLAHLRYLERAGRLACTERGGRAYYSRP